MREIAAAPDLPTRKGSGLRVTFWGDKNRWIPLIVWQEFFVLWDLAD